MGVGHRNGRVGMFDKDVGGVRDGRKPEVAATAQLSDPRAFGRQQSRVCRGEGQQRLRRGWGQDWEEGYGERRGGGGGGRGVQRPPAAAGPGYGTETCWREHRGRMTKREAERRESV